MQAKRDPIENILAEVCTRDRFTCQPCGKTMENSE
jgi:hypothetical protein